MNALGNCCLLEKSFNIAKGAEPRGAFLLRVHEFKTGTLKVDDWMTDLGVDFTLVDPSGKAASDVRTCVEARTLAMNGRTQGVPGRRAATRRHLGRGPSAFGKLRRFAPNR